MPEFLSFFIVLFAGLIFSGVLGSLHFPWVIALMLGGMIIGPQGLDFYEPDSTIEFLGQIGLVFLMFMAGIETRVSDIAKSIKSILPLAFINAVFPFITGLAVGYFFNYSWATCVLIGIIFISSSVAVVIPSLETNRLLETKLGNLILSMTVIEDISSLLLLSILLQSRNPATTLPLPILYFLLLVTLILLRWVIQYSRTVTKSFLAFRKPSRGDIFQQELRTILVILLGTVIVFELLGLHPITAGFFAGLVLSGSIKSEYMMFKFRAISYGIFIPVFFILVGVKTDITVIQEAKDVVFLVVSVVLGSTFSKFFSGLLGGIGLGLGSKESSLIGASTIPSLSTTLAVAFTGQEFGLLDRPLTTAIVVLTIVSTFISPILVDFISKKA